MPFAPSPEELAIAEQWLAEHNRTCHFADPMKCGAIGGRLTYSFTPTTMGQVIKITCACGESKDCTDYDSW